MIRQRLSALLEEVATVRDRIGSEPVSPSIATCAATGDGSTKVAASASATQVNSPPDPYAPRRLRRPAQSSIDDNFHHLENHGCDGP